jgi:hypothetical protein
MKITDNNFRDSFLTEITIGYDWDNSGNYAQLKVADNNKNSKSYRITGLKEYSIFEDFQAMYIEHCNLVKNKDGIYLCLDPYNESEISEDKDNYYFRGTDIVELQ